MSESALMLDLSVVRSIRSNEEYPRNFDDQELIPGVLSAIKYFAECNYFIVGFSNALETKTTPEIINIESFFLGLCPRIAKIYFSPDSEGRKIGCAYSGGQGQLLDLTRQSDRPDIPSLPDLQLSSCRLPAPGMFEYFFETHNIDRDKSIWVSNYSIDLDCSYLKPGTWINLYS